ncbi:DNA polymerase III subunit psi [Shewanella yunxiaonensis]|uniref:DNA polymerase III subunit psi n=1 Tax=Shewanella yunxiaonensis TaxID=2829809 RepID=A0ABX7YRE2_9GAMM|nr:MULTISPECIES: DNA polymerase III subunit psi [Shewanella]MDF0533912.1 DNA polymerase III subunit psi [Shewanella sp. A32]QUN05093.1 DNA polymerase III subunit psi [Shewanella yunxiaonensis]
MNKFLYAMGVTEWHLRASSDVTDEVFLLADAGQSLLQHPIVATVLALLGIAPEKCRVVAEVATGTNVLWSFGESTAHNATLSTPALASLQSDSEAKRVLWQQLWRHLDNIQ